MGLDWSGPQILREEEKGAIVEVEVAVVALGGWWHGKIDNRSAAIVVSISAGDG